jgi:hypothetical protein
MLSIETPFSKLFIKALSGVPGMSRTGDVLFKAITLIVRTKITTHPTVIGMRGFIAKAIADGS